MLIHNIASCVDCSERYVTTAPQTLTEGVGEAVCVRIWLPSVSKLAERVGQSRRFRPRDWNKKACRIAACFDIELFVFKQTIIRIKCENIRKLARQGLLIRGVQASKHANPSCRVLRCNSCFAKDKINFSSEVNLPTLLLGTNPKVPLSVKR